MAQRMESSAASSNMDAEEPVLEENPVLANKVEEQMLKALEKLGKRLDSLEEKTTQSVPEKHYIGSSAGSQGNGSWQNCLRTGATRSGEDLHRPPGQRDGCHDG